MPVTDARGLPDGEQIEADLVIVGGGIAGLILAHELAQSAVRVAILEGGGLEPDAELQKLYDGPAVMKGPGNPDRTINSYLGQSRVRALGGSGHVWGGKCGPLDAIDFASRPWRPLSGWPFGRKELTPYYDRACDHLKLPRFPQDGGLPQGTPFKPLGEATAALRASPRAYSPLSGRVDPAAFRRFCDAPAKAQNIHIYLYANVTALRLNGAGEVDHLELRCLNGPQMTARGRRYVLAAGGIENARLLLASNKERPEGVASASDWVGRCFQGHVVITTGVDDPRGDAEAMLATSQDLALYDSQARDRPHAVFVLDPQEQQRLGVGNCTMTLSLQPKPAPKAGALGASAIQLYGAIEGRTAQALDFFLMSEEAPDRDSRITLSAETDALGQPRAQLEWRYGQSDWDSLNGSATGFAMAFGGQGLGRICWPVDTKDVLTSMSPSRHHMGTTRMSATPSQGVVDADCRAHEVANLYVAGSSVFPTSGLVNPTLTLAALAIRLADHLKRDLGAA